MVLSQLAFQGGRRASPMASCTAAAHERWLPLMVRPQLPISGLTC